MLKIETSETFDKWLLSLKDKEAARRIYVRIYRAINGNFGDFKFIGEGIYEMRLTYGAGYRIYYKKTGDTVYFILCGGDKSTQSNDIEKAKFIASQLDSKD